MFNHKTMWYSKGQRHRVLIMLLCALTLLPLSAQNPTWVKKTAPAVFTLKTFRADGSLLSSTNGFFISETGEAVSSFAPFKGAQRAVVIDAQGKEWPVECIIGGNDMYDVAKFKVDIKKPATLIMADATTANGATIWLLPYKVKKDPACTRGTISSSEQFQDKYAYYTMSLNTDEQQAGCPVMNEAGEVIGLLQPSADSNSASSYAVSVRFAADMHMSGLGINDPALRQTAVAKAIPEKYDEAVLSLFMGVSIMEAGEYSAYVERFIRKYPNRADGYIYRARQEMGAGRFADADADMKNAVKVAEQKDDAHYQYAQLIFQKELLQGDQPYDGWSLDMALQESKEAYRINPQPIYLQQQAQILYAQKKYNEAFNIYEELSKTDLRNADNFFAAAQCKLQIDDKKAALMQLDSAVSMFSRPYVKTAAPYLRVRAQLSMEMRRFQQAINDMQDLVALEPTNADLWAEKASYELRVNLFDQALESSQECLRLNPAGSDGYLMSGIVQCIKGDKQQGLENLNKAKELGNDQAQKFIDKYSQ